MLAIAIPAGLLIGLSLGALGGGGSILTVPALVYLLHQPPHAATTGSLLIVGITAVAGMAMHWRGGRVRIVPGVAFGLLGIAGSYAGTRLSASISPDLLLTLFSGLMLAAAAAMVRGRAGGARPAVRPAAPAAAHAERPPAPGGPAPAIAAMAPAGRAMAAALDRPGPHAGHQAWGAAWPRLRDGAAIRSGLKIAAAATVVGLLTGFFGVGGGFVIVPALVLALGFGMPAAVGTSLLVIAINAVAALAARLGSHVHLDWPLLGIFTAAALAGALAGNRIASRVAAARLTAAFAVLLVAVAGYTLLRSVPGLA
jgi:uncharacterized protein